MLSQGAGVLAAAHVPKVKGSTQTPRSQGLAVRTEGQGMDRANTLEGGGILAAGHLPEQDRVVIAARCQSLAIRAKGHGNDIPDMPLEGGGVLARLQVP